MATFKFKEEEIFRNTAKVHPSYKFMIYSGTVYIDNEVFKDGLQDTTNTRKVRHIPSGYVSLYEMNIDRDETSHTYNSSANTGIKTMVFPFITKNGSLQNFATVTTSSFHNSFSYGDIITGSYPLSSSLYRNYYPQLNTSAQYNITKHENGSFDQRPHIIGLRNTLDYYKTLSPHYAFTASHGTFSWDKAEQEMNLISIPSIFYGSEIKKGSLKLNFYFTGTLIGTLQDVNRNGELIQTGPEGSTGSGSVAGVALYREGFLILTGSWDLHNTALNYVNNNLTLKKSKWIYWGAGITGFSYDANQDVTASHCDVTFEGTNYVNTITMLAHAPVGQVNHSNNPTYVEKSSGYLYDVSQVHTAAGSTYSENPTLTIKNVTETKYQNITGSFKKTTFISKVGIYDDDGNLIAIAKVAKPVKKTEDREYTFKLKLDF